MVFQSITGTSAQTHCEIVDNFRQPVTEHLYFTLWMGPRPAPMFSVSAPITGRTGDQALSEQHRKLERRELGTAILIRNSMSGDSIGELVNLTVEGLMIISDQEMSTNSIFQFSLEVPDGANNTTSVELGVDCLWSRPAENFNRHWSGYQIIDASPDALKTIDRLISGYSGQSKAS